MVVTMSNKHIDRDFILKVIECHKLGLKTHEIMKQCGVS